MTFAVEARVHSGNRYTILGDEGRLTVPHRVGGDVTVCRDLFLHCVIKANVVGAGKNVLGAAVVN